MSSGYAPRSLADHTQLLIVGSLSTCGVSVALMAGHSNRTERLAAGLLAASVFQLVAAVYYLGDAYYDAEQSSAANFLASTMELFVAFALLFGVLVGGFLTRHLWLQARREREALRLARGAVGEMIAERFAGWNLTSAEAEVALFALKGFSANEIADLRKSAPGTVRAQLSQIYAKAGVTTQSMLVSLFLDELIDGPAEKPAGHLI